MGKQSETSRQTRQNLMDAFWFLSSKKNSLDITVKDICAKAGYNRGTFYEYFKDTRDLLLQLENDVMPDIKELPLSLNDANGMGLRLDSFIAAYENKANYLKVLLGEHGDPTFMARIKTKVKQSLKEKLIAMGVSDSFELDFTLEYAEAAMNGVLNYYFSLEDKPPIEKFYELLVEISTYGVLKTIDKLKRS